MEIPPAEESPQYMTRTPAEPQHLAPPPPILQPPAILLHYELEIFASR
ncbi:Protein of unknown function [Pyronema omphalodes CBS 100304]|uniref:Uncharacterized protein n=1 Tax=Pyronema omphalodes (strain CBS 100304) TaxID=1076935 RepID=U4LEW6_PYROM|nr:Protein of unknown function [Pyronema omphalodes CBS 100304]